MKKATFENAAYVPSDSIEVQGNQSKIQKYLNRGYYIKQNRNGYWVVVKPAQVIVTISDEDGQKFTFNMKENICEIYGRLVISEKLFDKFAKDASTGKIQFELNEYGGYEMYKE